MKKTYCNPFIEKYTFYKSLWIAGFIMLFLPCHLMGQWNSFVTNHEKSSFGRGAQTWQIKVFGGNRIFCGNKNGLIEYNGNQWQLYPTVNGSDIRSVHISETLGRVYVGGESEFGFFEPGEDGHLLYHRTSEEFTISHSLHGGYWGVYEADHILYYVSDWWIVKEVEEQFTLIESEAKIDCSGMIDGVLYVGTGDGIKMLAGNHLLPVPGMDVLKDKNIRAIVSYREGLLIATAFQGLYQFRENELFPLATGKEAFMAENEIFSLAVSDSRIAVGTIHKGLLLLNDHDWSCQYYNEYNGLQNNTVLSVAFDRDNNLWLGLDNGIDHITLNSPFTNLYFSPYSKGAGYCWLEEKGRFYLGTNRGLFTIPSPLTLSDEPADFRLMPELSGQVWDLEKVGEEILCFHDKGLYVIENRKSTLIPGLRGSISGASWPGDPQKYWIGTYEGLYLIQKENTWKVKQRIEGVSYWWRNMVSEAPGILWARSQNSSVSRIELDTIHYTVKKVEVFGIEEGFTSVKDLYIHKLQGEICFSTSSGIYRYDPEAGRMKLHETYNSWFLPGRSYTVLKAKGNSIYALSADLIQIARFSEDGRYLSTGSYPFNYSRIDFIPYYEELEILNDSLLVIPNEHGYALLNTRLPFPDREDPVIIQSVHVTYPKDSLIYKNNYRETCPVPAIPYVHNSIRFEYAFSSFSNERSVKVRHRLMPDQAWSDYAETGGKEYTNLHEGKYTFEVEALFSDGKMVTCSYPFTIQSPWFRSVYAYLMGMAGMILLLWLFYRLAVYRAARRRKEELEQKEKELFLKEQEFIRENLRKEKAIIRLENEKLEQELAFKNQELANLMIHLSRKNEILTSIKQELHKVVKELQKEDHVKAKRMLLTLNSSIDLNMQSEEVLKRFEEQFDLVHNNFIRKLTEKHPDLNISERKMCAYLKMNLTSKEIAPLLNLSLRGVETLRYRLRKKLELGREDNLMDYLNQFV